MPQDWFMFSAGYNEEDLHGQTPGLLYDQDDALIEADALITRLRLQNCRTLEVNRDFEDADSVGYMVGIEGPTPELYLIARHLGEEAGTNDDIEEEFFSRSRSET